MQKHSSFKIFNALRGTFHGAFCNTLRGAMSHVSHAFGGPRRRVRQRLHWRVRRRAFGVFGLALLTATPGWASVPGVLAQAPAQLKEGFQFGLGILFMVGFIWGVINIWGGADRLKKGDADGKMGIVSGIIIAGAAAIMAALFYIFGMSDGALTPQF